MTARRRFVADTSSVREARRFAGDSVGPLSDDDLDAVLVMVSERASNAVRHARSSYQVAVSRNGGVVRVAVTDEGPGEPAIQDPSPTTTSGRGLRIVDHLSDDWGIDRHAPVGKTVWFTYVTEPVADAAEDAVADTQVGR